MPGALAGSPPPGRGRHPVRVAVAVGVVVAAWAVLALPARATWGARTTADEPQYLLSALSLGEDGDLTIGDELAARRYAPFHEVLLPPQTQVLPDGREVSPHDPLLPALLAAPMGLGGWAAAKGTLAVLGGVLSALLVWTAHRRFAVPLGVAAVTVLAFGVTPPLTAYATQVYPELPAAVAVTVAIATLAGRRRPADLAGFAGATVALPWLGVKYVPVAGALVAVAVWLLVGERRRRAAAALVAGLAVAGLAYLVVHRIVYGGWTVYAAGDHFSGGELTVMGDRPDRLGRSRRLTGLLLDRGFGLAAWMPGYLLAVPALAVVVRRRPPGWSLLLAPLAAGWATATWVALTMHGWWWPGRQVVVAAPCLVLAVAWWAGRARAVRPLVAAAGAWGAAMWVWLVVEVLRRQRTLVVDFEGTRDPLYRAWHASLPDYRTPHLRDWVAQAVWLAVLGGAVLVALRWPRRSPSPGRPH
ncbi:MAG TPA: hypothetical protein VFI47_28355 [Acidimicrobiales bacterium]|nr:hypothetical protein [Acidimicrobiales bacterium]